MLNNDSSDSDQTSNYNLKEEINNGNEQERSIAGSRMKYETNSSSDSNKNLQQSDNDTLEGPSDNDLSGNDNQGNKNIKQYQSSLFNRKRDNTHNLNERQQHYYSSQQLKRQSDDSLLDAIESFEPLSTRKTASITRGEATLLDIMETPNRGKEYLMDTDNGRNVGENEYDKLNRSKPVNPSVEKINTSFVSNPVLFPENMQSSSPWVLTRLLSTTGTPQQIRRTPMKKQQRSKIPVRSASSSQSRSRSISHSPATRKRTINNVVDINGHQTSLTSKIPVRIKTEQSQHTEKASAANYPPVTEKGAFRLFTSNENLHSESDVLSVFERGKAYYNQQDPPTTTSPFVPINSVNQQKIAPEAKQSNASTKHRLITRNAISADGHYKSKTATATTNLTSAIDPGRLTSQQYLIEDSDDTSSIETKSKAELATQLKEEKRHYKKTATILNQLHENYGQLLEKYAQAENTIDQLRFQPKLYDNSTPPANVIEVCDVYNDA
ncbi:unnamed protein product [Didymodactylos carnosus]|uniref:Uncharacterized protein n=1 Tax=Didymodactylos carnosus TaxID=1234261 RepID=A0A813XYJ6_9BILA|nr:unnamed protein product [Didymodactylos carnosus]CAF0871907.1 unnamed protein product [Didymodactylos carnosus]CAF3522256.1 unnamed protein product [Didymodactylos carnosus]CAF3659300.1 unnamed protein product [Didymodactylos carnosus]